MPTPKQLQKVYREQQLAAQGDFLVHEVIECLSEGEDGFGEEDLQPHPQIPQATTPTPLPEEQAKEKTTPAEVEAEPNSIGRSAGVAPTK